MPKNPIQGWFRSPLDAVLGTRAKTGILRALHRGDTPVSLRELARRTGLAVRSVELAAEELLMVGVLEWTGAGRGRLLGVHQGHRLAGSLAALFEAEAGHWATLRVELRALADGLAEKGVVAMALVGAGARGAERLVDRAELLVLVRRPEQGAAIDRLLGVGLAGLERRFGVPMLVHRYDLEQAQAMWRQRTAAAERMVEEAELFFGGPLEPWLAGGGSVQ